MVSSAVFGAAAGTGLALVVAVTIVVYRYYSMKRKGKYWSNLDRWPDPPTTKRAENRHQERRLHGDRRLQEDSRLQEDCTAASHVLDCWRPQKNYYAVQSREVSVSKEQQASKSSPVRAEASAQPHKNRSYSSGGGIFGRNSSVSSQSSLESASSLRGSSPQIRAFGPDGRYNYRNPVHTASSYPPSRSSRSPSPGRAASLDMRCGSAASCSGSTYSNDGSPSHSSLSMATGVSSSHAGSSLSVGHGPAYRAASRSLSPLLIPPTRTASEGGSIAPASPLGSLQPHLYLRKQSPIFLRVRRNGKSLGRLHLILRYDSDRSDLNVHLIEAHSLPTLDQGGFKDPFVTITLTPEVDNRKRQTQIFSNEPNPVFDQEFKFPVSYDELQDKTLLLQVQDYDRTIKNDIVGTVRIVFETLELAPASSLEVWGEIERERKPPEEVQQVLLSLSYLPSAGRLTVHILKARNLFPPQDKNTVDSFVKVNLICGEKKVKKRKTAVQKATTNPVWNEAKSFDVPASILASSAIEVCVMDTSNEFIGACIIGPATSSFAAKESCNSGREHWCDITQSPRKTTPMWHTLH